MVELWLHFSSLAKLASKFVHVPPFLYAEAQDQDPETLSAVKIDSCLLPSGT